jgi:hypothetical protein
MDPWELGGVPRGPGGPGSKGSNVYIGRVVSVVVELHAQLN